jgi:hypothetical protein
MKTETDEENAAYAAAVKAVRAIIDREPGTFWNDQRRIAESLLVCRGHDVFWLRVVSGAVRDLGYSRYELLCLGLWLGDIRNSDNVEYLAFGDREGGAA